ncbi:MAG TPA: GNAT family N-acetyltransferase [Caulobacteraceae bacterium]|nr:GNAT family N-acetyltransferase [Caulobacteraceae bacterium]
MDEILTPRLRLRRARLEDADPLFEVFADPRAMRYWSTPPHADIEDTRRFVRAMLGAPEASSDDFVIELEGRVVGKAGCWRLPEVGYILHPDLWGRGLAREAMQAVIERMFGVWRLPALTANVDPRNEPSLALLARLGFRETHRAKGDYRVGEEWLDSVYLQLDREANGAISMGPS